VVVRQKGPVFVHVMPGIMWWKLLVYIFAMALNGFYFDQTKGKGIELLARARKVFCYKKKNVGKRRARNEKQVWIAFHKLRSNLSFWVGSCQIKVWFEITKHLSPAFIVNGSRSHSVKRAQYYNDVPEAYTCTENRSIFITTCY